MSNASLLILMYHGIVDETCPAPPGREPGAAIYDVSAQAFAGQLGELRRQRIRVVWPGEDGQASPDLKEGASVVITFDDGEKNNAAVALPLLQQFGYKAYFFISPARIGTPGYLDWDDVKSLAAAGMRVGTHGLTHAILTGLDDAALHRELSESRRQVEERLSTAVTACSIPRGFYDARVLAAVRATGYRHVFVSDRRSEADDVWPRTAVKRSWDIPRFRLALQGRMPWPEAVFVRIKDAVKSVLGPGGYNFLRDRFVKESSS